MVERTVTIRAILEDRLSKPLTLARKGFKGVRRGIQDLDSVVGPLTSKVAALAAVLGGGAIASRSLVLAREQIQAERALLAALEGRVTAQQEILRIATAIQSVTEQGDEVLISQAALLANMGVSAEKIPRALQASVDTAAALGLELTSASKGIGLALTVGRAGELGERIGELAELQKEGKLASEVLDVLESKFSGQAIAQAGTIFGQITQQQNLLGDALERVGEILAVVYLPALAQVVEATEGVIEFLERPEFQGFIQTVRDNAAAVTRWAIALAGVVVAIGVISKFGFILKGIFSVGLLIVAPFKVFGGLLVTIAGLAASVAASLTVWPVAVAAIVAVVATLVFGFERVAKAVGFVLTFQLRIAKALSDAVGFTEAMATAWGLIRTVAGRFIRDATGVLRKISEGRLEVADLLDFVKTRVDQLGISLDSTIFAPVRGFIETTREAAQGLFETIGGLGTVAILRLAQAAGDRALGVFQFIANGFDVLFVALNDKLRIVGLRS